MVQISLYIEDGVKKKAEEACADIGLSLSAAIYICLKKLGRKNSYPLKYRRFTLFTGEYGSS